MQHRKHNRAVRGCSPSGFCCAPLCDQSMHSYLLSIPVLHSFLILDTYLESPGRKMADFQFCNTCFLSCGWSEMSMHKDPTPSPGIRLSVYVPTSVLLLLCSKIGTDPKCELHEIQTSNAEDSLQSWKTIKLHLCQPLPLIWFQIHHYPSHHKSLKNFVQPHMSKCPLMWYFDCPLCHVLMHLQPVRQWPAYSCGTMNPWQQFLKVFYLGNTNRIFIMSLISRSCFLLLRLLFPLWMAFLC